MIYENPRADERAHAGANARVDSDASLEAGFICKRKEPGLTGWFGGKARGCSKSWLGGPGARQGSAALWCDVTDSEVWEDLVEEVLFLCVRDDEIDFHQQEHHDDDDDPLGAAPVFPLQRAREYLQQNDEVDGARLQHFLEHVDLGVELVVFVALLQEFVVKVLSR